MAQGSDWIANIEGVVFDLDNTLTHRARSIREVADVFLLHFQEDLQPVHEDSVAELLLKTDGGGYGHPDNPYPSIKASIAHRLFHEMNWRHRPTERHLLAFWFTHFPRVSKPMPGAQVLLQTIQDLGLPMMILSNGNDVSRQATVDALGIRSYFSAVYSSDALGVKKPEPEAFHACADHLGVEPHQVLMVGDHPIVDISGAREAGLKTAWLRGFHDEVYSVVPTLTLNTLYEMADRFTQKKTETSGPASKTARR